MVIGSLMPKPMNYRKKTGTVEAYQTDVLREVNTAYGVAVARPSDWVLRYANGDLVVLNHEYFTKYYESVAQ